MVDWRPDCCMEAATLRFFAALTASSSGVGITAGGVTVGFGGPLNNDGIITFFVVLGDLI